MSAWPASHTPDGMYLINVVVENTSTSGRMLPIGVVEPMPSCPSPKRSFGRFAVVDAVKPVMSVLTADTHENGNFVSNVLGKRAQLCNTFGLGTNKYTTTVQSPSPNMLPESHLNVLDASAMDTYRPGMVLVAIAKSAGTTRAEPISILPTADQPEEVS